MKPQILTDIENNKDEITNLQTDLTTHKNDYATLEGMVQGVIDNDITAVLTNELVATDIANKLSAKEIEYAPRLTNAETQLAEKATKQEVNLKADKTYVNTLTQSIASGSPKGVYDSFNDLQTARPDGDSNIYVVAENGNWYYWNGTDWSAGGLYQSVLMNQTATIKIEGIEWEQGTISGGIEYLDIRRLRTKGFLRFKGKAVIHAKEGYKVGVTLYENGVYSSQTTFYSTPKIIEYDANKEYRLVIAKIDDSIMAIFESDVLLFELELPEAIGILGDGITEIKDIVRSDIAPFMEWEIGSLDGDNEFVSVTRIRTKNHFIFDSTVTFKLKDINYKYAIITYNKLTKLFVSTSGWLTDIKELPYNENYSYRFIIAKQDDTNMEVSEHNALTINVNTSTYLPLISDKIERLSSALETGDILTPKDFFVPEINDTISKIKLNTTEKSLVFAVLSDSHTYRNARQYIKDCCTNIDAINKKVHIDSIFHLGDMINGGNTIEEDTDNIEYVRDNLLSVHNDVFFAFGNHDDISYGTHYADGDYLTKGESYRLTHRHNERKVYREGTKLYYYIDYPTVKLRIIVLDSINIGDEVGYPESSWGYSTEQLSWVETVALNTDYNVLVFSHNPAIASMNYNNVGIANGTQLTTLLENWQTVDKRVLCLMSGHTHADKIDTTSNSFAHITIGTQHATNNELLAPGAVSPSRTAGTVTQDLWDVMVIKLESKVLKLIRFGAGEDRNVSFAP